MNNLIKVMFISLFLLLGCSFSKDASSNLHQKKESKPLISEKQKDLIAAIKLGNINLTKSAAMSLSPSEHHFLTVDETPMSIAIETNQPAMVQLLVQLNIDPGNLGHINDSLNQKILEFSLRKIYENVNAIEADKIKTRLTKSEEAFYELQASSLFKELESYMSKNRAEALANLKRLNLNCVFVANQTVVWAQSKDPSFNFKDLVPLVRSLSCSSSSENIDKIYKLELVRQFQNHYNQTSLLEYIFEHPNFGNPMWNIDDSGIWVSPSVLLNVVYSDENRDNSAGNYCSTSTFCSEEKAKAYEEKRNKLNKAGNKYDLILTKDGKILNSFLNFSAIHINDNDPFYITIALYMYGKRYYTEANNSSGDAPELIPWSIYFQTAEEGVHD